YRRMESGWRFGTFPRETLYGQRPWKVDTMDCDSERLSCFRRQSWIHPLPPELRRHFRRTGDGWRTPLSSQGKFRFTFVRFQDQEENGEFPPRAEPIRFGPETVVSCSILTVIPRGSWL